MRNVLFKTGVVITVLAFIQACGGSDGEISSGGGGGGNTIVVPPGTATIETNQVFVNLSFNAPLVLLRAPNDASRWFVAEQAGQVLVFDNDPMVTAGDLTTFIDISGQVTSGGERGLLGMAFHPNFPATPHVFLSFTGPDPNNGNIESSFVSRFTSVDGGLTLDSTTELVIIKVVQPFPNHNGGNIAFGPDGFLYIGWGDGGAGNDPQQNAQNTGNLLGAMLRIDVDQGNPYSIPPGNPFAGMTCNTGGCPEIYAYGLRNPWRWSFDALDGDLWLGDVGQNALEEVDIIDLGGNYGWPLFEGTQCNMNAPVVDCSVVSLPPVTEYAHPAGSVAITGGYVYRGQNIAGLVGVYVYTDFYDGAIRQYFDDGDGNVVDNILLQTSFLIPAFAEDINGEIYLLDAATGTIYRIDNAP
jgi:glucose/arabinose dehydrogenase